ncbi:hypothetical protein HNP81_000797 [Peribacillus huizhouensis]|uniref:Uncharacterized protein n=1 Tax=Peribacillus huizhouensis TaxID=1501239 RepID=A0ABR6CKC8_9BACI|nr:hypothetical protein [Peribacillus huizhouensis]
MCITLSTIKVNEDFVEMFLGIFIKILGDKRQQMVMQLRNSLALLLSRAAFLYYDGTLRQDYRSEDVCFICSKRVE